MPRLRTPSAGAPTVRVGDPAPPAARSPAIRRELDTSSGFDAVITAVYARVGLVQGGTTSRTRLPNPSPITDSVLADLLLGALEDHAAAPELQMQ